MFADLLVSSDFADLVRVGMMGRAWEDGGLEEEWDCECWRSVTTSRAAQSDIEFPSPLAGGGFGNLAISGDGKYCVSGEGLGNACRSSIWNGWVSDADVIGAECKRL